MRSRPVRNPIFLGLGTAAILAAGGAANAVLADTTPTPSPTPSGTEGSTTPSASDTPTPTPTPTDSKTPEAVLALDVNWTQSTKTVHAGTVVKGTVRVAADGAAAPGVHLTATASGGTISPACATQASGCTLSPIAADTTFDTPLSVRISSSKTSGTVPLTITVKDGSAQATLRDSITVRPAPTSSSKTTTHETSSNNTGGSGSSSNNTTSGSAPGGSAPLVPGSGAAFVPPSAAGQLAPATNGTQSAQFPQIAPQNVPPGVAAPGVGTQTQNMGALRAASPEPQELTFQRLASTQAAWLAALLVAFSLLLTHIRLNKPAELRRRRGNHRRQRAGVFQA